MTIFVDSAVVMYAAGADHPLRAACRRLLERVGDGEVDAVTSTEVVQEIIHRYLSIRRPDLARQIAADTLDLFAPVLPITHACARRLPDLVERYPTLQTRDLIHVAICIHEGIAEILTPDRGFDRVAEVRRVDPLAFPA